MFLVVLFFNTPALAAVPCPGGSSLASRALCADPALRTLLEAADDLEAGTAFRLGVPPQDGRADPGMVDALRAATRDWATTVRDPCGANERCLLHAVVRRLLAAASLPDTDATTAADAVVGSWWDDLEHQAFVVPLGAGKVAVALYNRTSLAYKPVCLFVGRGTVGAGGRMALRRDGPNNHVLTMRAVGNALQFENDASTLAARQAACMDGDATNLAGPFRRIPAPEPMEGDCSTAHASTEGCADPDVRALEQVVAFMQEDRGLPRNIAFPGTAVAALVGDLQVRAQARFACPNPDCVRRSLIARVSVLGRRPDPYAPGPVDPVVGMFWTFTTPDDATELVVYRVAPDHVGAALTRVKRTAANGAKMRAVCSVEGIGTVSADGTLVVIPTDAPNDRLSLRPGQDGMNVGTDAATRAALQRHCSPGLLGGQDPVPLHIPRRRGP